MKTRRGFLFGLLAAPAIVRVASLMPLHVPPSLVLYADGVHDDTQALQAFVDGERVKYADGRVLLSGFLDSATFKISSPIVLRGNANLRMHNCCLLVTKAHSPALIFNSGRKVEDGVKV